MKTVDFTNLQQTVAGYLNHYGYTLTNFIPKIWNAENTAGIYFLTPDNEHIGVLLTCFEEPFNLIQYFAYPIVAQQVGLSIIDLQAKIQNVNFYI